MTHTPMEGVMVLTPSANILAMAWGVTVFLSFVTSTAYMDARPPMKISRLLDMLLAPDLPRRSVKKVDLKK